MLKYLKENANRTRTENGAMTWRSTQSDCLDLFATIGALRNASDAEVRLRFQRAFAENPKLAMKILFYARDVRGGLGERRVFRTILPELAVTETESVRRNLALVPEFGRWDDLLSLMDTPCEKQAKRLMRKQLQADLDALEAGRSVSLLAKWLPSVNASNDRTAELGRRLAKSFGMTEREYRKALSALRERIRLIENSLRCRDYRFSYEKQPSKAMYRYRKAFLRNDRRRYRQFLRQVAKGKSKLHTNTLTPFEVIKPAFAWKWRCIDVTADEREAMDVTWNALPDYTGGENALVVVDGSGSMYDCGAEPAAVALSLGMYYAERNTGAFHNHFITFSETPRMVEIKGRDVVEKLRYCMRYNECADTNLQAVFELVLKTALEYNVPQEELPSRLYIISDMEFNYCVGDANATNFQYAKEMFEAHGYKLPEIVFWNVNSRNQQQPVTMNDCGVTLVSGYSPVLFKQIVPGGLTPYEQMMQILGGERYARIAA